MTDLCPHCDREWHGLAITERMEEMRAEYQREQLERFFVGEESDHATSAILDDYRYRDDASRVLCPGSLFIGPRAPIDAEAEQARKELLITADDSPWVILTPRLGSAYIEITPDMDPTDIYDALTPQQRALPRPSTTPPMWARQPNQRRRERSQR